MKRREATMMSRHTEHVLFDLSATQPLKGRVHGAAVYTERVLRRLATLREDVPLTCYYDQSRPLPNSVSDWLRGQDISIKPITSQSEIQSLLASGRFSVLFSALPYDLGCLDLKECRVVITIHGLRFVECPRDVEEKRYVSSLRERLRVIYKAFFLESYQRRQAAKFDRLLGKTGTEMQIAAVSKHTKYSLLAQCQSLSESQIHVLYSPRSPKSVRKTRSLEETKCQEHGSAFDDAYVLLVSANRWIKNAYRAVCAFDDLVSSAKERLGSVRCVLTGATESLLDRWRLEHRDRFTACGYVSRDCLDHLYASAEVFVYPTLNEGFGYPPLEAMRWGTPVICSGVTSVPEICGDAALYFNPLNVYDIRARLLQILSDPSLAEEMGERGRRRYREVAIQQDEMLDELCGLILNG